jgi:hypothetical protein
VGVSLLSNALVVSSAIVVSTESAPVIVCRYASYESVNFKVRIRSYEAYPSFLSTKVNSCISNEIVKSPQPKIDPIAHLTTSSQPGYNLKLLLIGLKYMDGVSVLHTVDSCLCHD